MSAPAARLWLRRLAGLLTLGVVALGITALFPSTRVGYIARGAWFQLDLLRRRVPVTEALTRSDLDPELRAGMERVLDVKVFGRELGFAPTASYELVVLDWERQLFNIAACPPLSFKEKTWWFPIVGEVPYLGFFREQDMEVARDRLEAEGLETYVRRIGTYSSLGWFDDPLLPGMLDDNAHDIASLVLHEMAHATVWVPGSVAFNETFASFVGDEAADRYIISRFGAASPRLDNVRREQGDNGRWRRVQHELYKDLEAVYKDKALSREQKLARKAELFAAFPDRVYASDIENKDKFARIAGQKTWNNARLIRFRTYSQGRGVFDDLLAKHNGDLLAFMREVQEIADDGPDPYEAVARAAAAR